jgi:hypothetical protein
MIMIRKVMRTTVAAAGFAALLLSGACAHTSSTDTADNRVVEVRPEDPAATGVAPGPALADSDGNVYSSSAAPGRGNPSNVGTNTNVNHIAENGRVEVRQDTITSGTTVDTTASMNTTPAVSSTDTTTAVVTTPSTTTTTRTETVNVPMTSSTQESTSVSTTEDTTTTTKTTPARTRMRKD